MTITVLLITSNLIILGLLSTNVIKHIKLKRKHAELCLKHNLTLRYIDTLSTEDKSKSSKKRQYHRNQ
jgi:BarA-like signal transduction histidine kinase